MSDLALGIDVGGTNIKLALVNLQGKIIKQSKHPTNIEGGYSTILLQIIQACREITDDLSKPIKGIGIGIAARVDSQNGIILSSDNLKCQNEPIQADLELVLKTRVKITNDVRAAALGEWHFGAGQGHHDLVCLFMGTGIGSGIISNGILLHGHKNIAGEAGHTCIDLDGPICSCGNKGCLEAHAGGWALAKKAKTAVRENAKNGQQLIQLVDSNIEKISAKEVIKGFYLNDPICTAIMEEAALALTTGAVNLINLFNPQLLILGGGIIEGCPELVTKITQGVRNRSIKLATQSVEIVKSALQDHAGTIGAASLYFKEKFDD